MTTTTTTPRRIYAVRDNATGKTRLVRAINVAATLRHVVRSAYTVDVATQDDLVELLTSGVSVEDARTTEDHDEPQVQRVRPRRAPAQEQQDDSRDPRVPDMFSGEPVPAATAVCEPVQVDAAGKLAGVPEVAAEQPGERLTVPATSAQAPASPAPSSPTAEATVDVHASTDSAQSPDAASAAAEPPASTADALRTARLSDAYRAGHDAGQRGGVGRYAAAIEITERILGLSKGADHEEFDDVRDEALRGFKDGEESSGKTRHARVPQVKYRDPATGATWSGRGIKPRWLVYALANGHQLGEFEAGA